MEPIMRLELDRAGLHWPVRQPKTCLVLTGLTMLWGLLPAALAQQDVDLQPGSIPRYTVELIVFTYRPSDSAGSEIFVPDKPAPTPRPDELPDSEAEDGQPELRRPGGQVIPQQEENLRELPSRERVKLELLDRREYTMDEIYRHLVRLDAYNPIMRTGWTQTTPAKAVAPAVHLRALGEPPLGLDGSVTLYLGRFVHLALDLALDAETERPAETATDRLVTYGDGRERNDSAAEFDGWLPRPVRYRIVEDRIMRNGEIRYFDHPRFGVIAKVTKARDDVRFEEGIGSGDQDVSGGTD
jgi:hypothetical protein